MIKLGFTIVAIISCVFILSAWQNAANGPCDSPMVGGHTGAPGETSCAGCHANSDNLNEGHLFVQYADGQLEYEPGKQYTISVKLKQAGITKFGFSGLAIRETNNATTGTFGLIDNVNTRVYKDGTRNYVSHTPCGADASDSLAWSFTWKAPTTDVGNINLYIAGLAANHDHSTSGDSTYTRMLTISPKTVTGISQVAETITVVQLSPNPFSTNTKLTYTLAQEEMLSISLYSINGQLIKIIKTGLEAKGQHSIAISADDIPVAGLYFIQIKGNFKPINTKVLRY